jgi:hypothetical protein
MQLGRLWRGELALDNAFWNWAVIGGLAVNLTSSIAGYIFSVPYNIFVSVGVWRSAERYTGERKWAELAQIVTLVGMVLLTVT